MQILDPAVESGLEKLNSDNIKDVILKVIKSQEGIRLYSYLESCIHCGLCSKACHFYLSYDKNPNLAPVGKIKNTLWKILKNKGNVSKEFLRSTVLIAHTQCNLCKRCIQYCPMGIDISYLIMMLRRIIYKLDITPLYIQDTVNSHSIHMNQMWVQADEWVDTLHWQEEEAQADIPDLHIPLDKNGADFMYSVIAPEPKFQASLIYQAAVLMHSAGVDWTMPSMMGWDNSDIAMFSGNYEITERLKKVHYECALNLRVRKIVMGECGHAFRSVYDFGNRLLGWKFPPLQVQHAIEFYYDLIKSKKIKILRKYELPVTLHDPCNISRGNGLHDKARYIIEKTCDKFVEMYPNREYNYCCSAGGGVINCGPFYKKDRIKSARIKAKQLFDAKTRGAKTLIAPCHNCHSGLEDTISAFGINLKVKFMLDIIYKCIEKKNEID